MFSILRFLAFDKHFKIDRTDLEIILFFALK